MSHSALVESHFLLCHRHRVEVEGGLQRLHRGVLRDAFVQASDDLLHELDRAFLTHASASRSTVRLKPMYLNVGSPQGLRSFELAVTRTAHEAAVGIQISCLQTAERSVKDASHLAVAGVVLLETLRDEVERVNNIADGGDREDEPVQPDERDQSDGGSYLALDVLVELGVERGGHGMDARGAAAPREPARQGELQHHEHRDLERLLDYREVRLARVGFQVVVGDAVIAVLDELRNLVLVRRVLSRESIPMRDAVADEHVHVPELLQLHHDAVVSTTNTDTPPGAKLMTRNHGTPPASNKMAGSATSPFALASKTVTRRHKTVLIFIYLKEITYLGAYLRPKSASRAGRS